MNQQISKLYTSMVQYHFERPHSSFLVNLDYVIGIKNYIVYMVNGIEIPYHRENPLNFIMLLITFWPKQSMYAKEHNVMHSIITQLSLILISSFISIYILFDFFNKIFFRIYRSKIVYVISFLGIWSHFSFINIYSIGILNLLFP